MTFDRLDGYRRCWVAALIDGRERAIDSLDRIGSILKMGVVGDKVLRMETPYRASGRTATGFNR